MDITNCTEYLALLRQAQRLSRIIAIVAQAPGRDGRTQPDLARDAEQAHQGLHRLLAALAHPLSTESSAPLRRRGDTLSVPTTCA